MIKHFADKDTEILFLGTRSRNLPQEIQRIARRKLMMLHAAAELRDLCTPPGNRLEKMQDPKLPNWSIRINGKWRIVFDFDQGDATNVRITDHYQG